MTLAAATVAAAVATRLTGLPLTGARVFNGRQAPLEESDLPCWRIVKGDEPIESQGFTYPAAQLHALEIAAEGVLRDSSTLEADMDALAAQGLAALFATTPPYQLTCSAIARDRPAAGERSVGVVTLQLRALFYTAQNAPESILS